MSIIAHLIDQRKMIWFRLKISQSECSVLKTLAYLKRSVCNVLRSKYGLCSYDGVDAIKYAVFERFFCCSLWHVILMWFLWFY